MDYTFIGAAVGAVILLATVAGADRRGTGGLFGFDHSAAPILGQGVHVCHKRFGELHWGSHKQALVDAERKAVQWNEIPAEKLEETKRTHLPACWGRHAAETFRREHPEASTNRGDGIAPGRDDSRKEGSKLYSFARAAWEN